MLDYNTYISQISNLAVIPSSDPNFQTMVPGMIDYAEQRIYRELNPLRTQVTSSVAASSDDRSITLTSSYIVIDNVNVITPVTAGTSNGTRNQCVPVSLEFLDIAYPDAQTATGLPAFFAMQSDTELILGPSPDAAYTVELVGLQRPVALSSANSSTYLTQYCPDLFVAASMVFISGYMRDFGQQADNQQMGVSWEGQYQKLFASAAAEQSRARVETPNMPPPIAGAKTG